MRKSTENIKWLQHSIPLWLLLLIMSFFSSCTVRKGIQVSLEVPVTRQLNPSKATSNQQSACHYVEVGADLTFTFTKVNSDTGFPHLIADHIIQPEIRFISAGRNTTSGWPLSLKIESYILFKQMKFWIYS